MLKIPDSKRVFSALEVANLCGVVNQTAINWIRSGRLKAFTTPGGQYRIYIEDLLQFLSSHQYPLPVPLDAYRAHRSVARSMLVASNHGHCTLTMKEKLEQNFTNFLIIQASDLFEAGKAVVEHKPGIIILDTDFPGLEGPVILQKIKTVADNYLPFIVSMNFLPIPPKEALVLAQGTDAFFTAPFDVNQILATIRDMTEKMGASR